MGVAITRGGLTAELEVPVHELEEGNRGIQAGHGSRLRECPFITLTLAQLLPRALVWLSRVTRGRAPLRVSTLTPSLALAPSAGFAHSFGGTWIIRAGILEAPRLSAYP